MTTKTAAAVHQDELMRAAAHIARFRKIETVFPNKGEFARRYYKKHLMHFEAGAKYKQRLFMCANRVGKTVAGGCELVYHCTGEYPQWWKGKRFETPQNWWIAGNSSKTVLKIFQPLLLGEVGEFGTGLIPKSSLDFTYMTAAKKGDTLVTDYRIKHTPTGGWSTVTIKAYEEGRKSFEGTERNIWLDEEPPADIYNECLARTMTGGCILYMTFTPLQGPTDTVSNFLGEDLDYEDGARGSFKWVTGATQDDVPHLSKEEKQAFWESTLPYLREARTKGIPLLGSGTVYPFSEDKLFIDPIVIPDHWRRVMSLDFGWITPTAILWGAIDPDTDNLYIYHESYLRETPPAIHADIIKTQWKLAGPPTETRPEGGFPIPAVCDPSGGGKNITDGEQARLTYLRDYQITLMKAKNPLEPGIAVVFDRMIKGKVKVFTTCSNFRNETRKYVRDETGRLRGPDHLMDALRYMVVSGMQKAQSFTQWKTEQHSVDRDYNSPDDFHMLPDAWMYS